MCCPALHSRALDIHPAASVQMVVFSSSNPRQTFARRFTLAPASVLWCLLSTPSSPPSFYSPRPAPPRPFPLDENFMLHAGGQVKTILRLSNHGERDPTHTYRGRMPTFSI